MNASSVCMNITNVCTMNASSVCMNITNLCTMNIRSLRTMAEARRHPPAKTSAYRM